MTIDFTQQCTSNVGLIEQPQIMEFSRAAMMRWIIMVESKKSTNSHLMVGNLLILSYSNVISLILQ